MKESLRPIRLRGTWHASFSARISATALPRPPIILCSFVAESLLVCLALDSAFAFYWLVSKQRVINAFRSYGGAFKIVSPEASNESKMPNSCQNAGCHADKTPKWAIEAYDDFYGKEQ